MKTQINYPVHMHQDCIGLHPGFENLKKIIPHDQVCKGVGGGAAKQRSSFRAAYLEGESQANAWRRVCCLARARPTAFFFWRWSLLAPLCPQNPKVCHMGQGNDASQQCAVTLSTPADRLTPCTLFYNAGNEKDSPLGDCLYDTGFHRMYFWTLGLA